MVAELQHFKNLELSFVWITHCSGCVGLKTCVHAASSWPWDSPPWVLIFSDMIIILASKFIMMCGFISWSVAVMISSPNDHFKQLLNHVGSLFVGKITYTTCVRRHLIALLLVKLYIKCVSIGVLSVLITIFSFEG